MKGGGEDCIDDFRDTLKDLYLEYVDALRNWTNEHLGLQLSNQPGYTSPVDALATIPHVDVPECESLGLSENTNVYRQFTGPANLAERNVISNELGAYFMDAYSSTLSHLLFSFNRAFAGGVNEFVTHGQGYSGDYYNTTRPGYTGFSFVIS